MSPNCPGPDYSSGDHRRERRARRDKHLEKKTQHGLLDTVSNDRGHAICAQHPDIHCLSAIFAFSAVNNPGWEP